MVINVNTPGRPPVAFFTKFLCLNVFISVVIKTVYSAFPRFFVGFLRVDFDVASFVLFEQLPRQNIFESLFESLKLHWLIHTLMKSMQADNRNGIYGTWYTICLV